MASFYVAPPPFNEIHFAEHGSSMKLGYPYPRHLRKALNIICLFYVIMDKLVEGVVSSSESVHSRQKRILWVTTDGRLALPPGTTLIVNPSLSLPFVRYPPDGFFSNMTISLPFTIDFDKLGLTDNENPYGVISPLLARSMGNGIMDILGSYISNFIKRRRSKRAPPEPPPNASKAFHGGERALLYVMVEDFLENFGMNGKACLLRAICEVHANPMHSYGLLGETLKLFFTASKSPYSKVLQEYVDAENAGSGKSGPAECWPYMKDCPKSLFRPRHNYYNNKENSESETKVEEHTEKSPEVTFELNKFNNM